MKTVTLTQLRRDLEKVIEALVEAQEPVTITRYGKPVAVLMPVAQYEELVSLKEKLEKSTNEQVVS